MISIKFANSSSQTNEAYFVNSSSWYRLDEKFSPLLLLDFIQVVDRQPTAPRLERGEHCYHQQQASFLQPGDDIVVVVVVVGGGG